MSKERGTKTIVLWIYTVWKIIYKFSTKKENWDCKWSCKLCIYEMQTVSLRSYKLDSQNRLFPLWFLMGSLPEHQSWRSLCCLGKLSWKWSRNLKLAYYHRKIRHQVRDCLFSNLSGRGEHSVKQLTDLLVNTAEEVHIGGSSVESFIFHQELPENHLPLLTLLHYDELHGVGLLLLDIIHYDSELLRVWISQLRQRCQICVDMCKRWHIKYSLNQLWWAAHS